MAGVTSPQRHLCPLAKGASTRARGRVGPSRGLSERGHVALVPSGRVASTRRHSQHRERTLATSESVVGRDGSRMRSAAPCRSTAGATCGVRRACGGSASAVASRCATCGRAGRTPSHAVVVAKTVMIEFLALLAIQRVIRAEGVTNVIELRTSGSGSSGRLFAAQVHRDSA